MTRDVDPGLVTAAEDGDPVALTRVMVATPSVNPELEVGGAGEADIARLAVRWLDSWGFATTVSEVAPGRFNVVGRLGGTGPVLLLNGHLDTVGVAGMTVPPFGGELEGDRLSGRGSCDMKGGVGALLAAAHRLAKDGPRPPLIVLLTADEEHASVGMASFVEDRTVPARDTGPDGAGGGDIGRPQATQATQSTQATGAPGAPPADLAIVCEPTSLMVMPAHKGFVWLRVRFRGRAAHGSRPDLGVDAIRHAGLFMAALESHAVALRSRPAHPLLGHGSLHAGTIHGGVGESVYPDRCELTLECRTLPGESADDVLAEIQSVLEDLRASEPSLSAELVMTLARPGTEVPASSALVRGLLDASAAHGLTPGVEGMTAWVDAAYLNEAGVPAVCFGPGAIEQAHTADEWIDVREIRACADVLETFARGLATD